MCHPSTLWCRLTNVALFDHLGQEGSVVSPKRRCWGRSWPELWRALLVWPRVHVRVYWDSDRRWGGWFPTDSSHSETIRCEEWVEGDEKGRFTAGRWRKVISPKKLKDSIGLWSSFWPTVFRLGTDQHYRLVLLLLTSAEVWGHQVVPHSDGSCCFTPLVSIWIGNGVN